ncbi:hypothetical protein A2635_03155 [Candidatus Peribacteria bacterium RIFCSPHIGHO2_01_FULL_51_9]|nr:MAG: hypothetical protein A2635_03155 [Candidatus Peribacteria bacterium RIFCSPHIGHO2_01_FULL_51_9]
MHIEKIRKKMYNDVVQHRHRHHIHFGLLFMACLLLARCSTQKDLPYAQGTDTALIPTVILSQKKGGSPSLALSRPSALLGLHVTQFLSRQGGLLAKAALQGVFLHLRRFPPSKESDQTIAAIEKLGTLLHRNIADSLNQSTNRQRTLNVYIEQIREAIAEASMQSTNLEETLDRYTDEYRIHKSRTRTISSELKRALRDTNYSLASQKQEELGEAQSLLANAEVDVEKTEGILDIYKELLPLAEERLTAIEQNREVIVAGLRVVEMPGIDDLGIFDRMR